MAKSIDWAINFSGREHITEENRKATPTNTSVAGSNNHHVAEDLAMPSTMQHDSGMQESQLYESPYSQALVQQDTEEQPLRPGDDRMQFSNSYRSNLLLQPASESTRTANEHAAGPSSNAHAATYPSPFGQEYPSLSSIQDGSQQEHWPKRQRQNQSFKFHNHDEVHYDTNNTVNRGGFMHGNSTTHLTQTQQGLDLVVNTARADNMANIPPLASQGAYPSSTLDPGTRTVDSDHVRRQDEAIAQLDTSFDFLDSVEVSKASTSSTSQLVPAVDPRLSVPLSEHTKLSASPANSIQNVARNSTGPGSQPSSYDARLASTTAPSLGAPQMGEYQVPTFTPAGTPQAVQPIHNSMPMLGKRKYRDIAPKPDARPKSLLASSVHQAAALGYGTSVGSGTGNNTFVAPAAQIVQPNVFLGLPIGQQPHTFHFVANVTPANFQPPPRRQAPLNNGVRRSNHTTRVHARAQSQGNANGTVANKKYLDDLLDAVPVNTCFPAGMLVSVVEVLAFSPNSFQIPQFGHRATCNGWSMKHIATVTLHYRGRLQDAGAYKRAYDRLKYQIQKNEGIILGIPDFTMTKHKHLLTPVPPPYDTTGWTGRPISNPYNHDPLLVDMGRGVTIMPTGDDRWHLTKAIEYARRNPNEPWKLSQVMQLVNDPTKTFAPLPACHNSQNCDQDAAVRHAHLLQPVPH